MCVSLNSKTLAFVYCCKVHRIRQNNLMYDYLLDFQKQEIFYLGRTGVWGYRYCQLGFIKFISYINREFLIVINIMKKPLYSMVDVLVLHKAM